MTISDGQVAGIGDKAAVESRNRNCLACCRLVSTCTCLIGIRRYLGLAPDWPSRAGCSVQKCTPRVGCIAWARQAWAGLARCGQGGIYLNFAGMGEEKEALVHRGTAATTSGWRRSSGRLKTSHWPPLISAPASAPPANAAGRESRRPLTLVASAPRR